MSYVLTNKTAQTPLGFGALGFTLQPGESRTVTTEQFAQVEAHPVMAGWIAEGKVGAEAVVAEPDTSEAEALPPPAPPAPPKVPTPTAKK